MKGVGFFGFSLKERSHRMMLQIPFEYLMWETFDSISSNSYNPFIDAVMDANGITTILVPSVSLA